MTVTLGSRLGFWSTEAHRIAQECKLPTEVSPVEWGQLAKTLDDALTAIEQLASVRNALIEAGGANPSIGKARFSVWNLARLAAAFEAAVASTGEGAKSD